MATCVRTRDENYSASSSGLDSVMVTSVSLCSANATDTLPLNSILPINIHIYDDIISKPAVRVAIIVVYLVVILIATFGNILVILVIYRRRSLRRNPAILLILNLAFCDLISCVVYRPLLLVELFLPFTSMQVYNDQAKECRVASYFQGMLAGVGFHTMVLISQERLLLIVYPLKAKLICTFARTIKMLAVIWLLSAACYLPVPLLFEEVRKFHIDGTLLPFCGYFSGSASAIIFFSFIFGFYFVIPLIVITVSYVKIFKALYQRMEELNITPSTGGSKSIHTRRKLAKMMLAVSIIFALCWGPNFVFFLWLACGQRIKSNGLFVGTIVEFLPLISSAINPFIYTLNSKTFQSGLKHMLCIRYCRPHLEESSLYRSFNSLYIPNTGMVSPSNVRRNLLFSRQTVHRNSTFVGSCRRSVSMPIGQLNAFEKRSRNGLKAPNNIHLSAHARRNTFVRSDWEVQKLNPNQAHAVARERSYTQCSLDFQSHLNIERSPFLSRRNCEEIELKTFNTSQ